MVSRKIGDKLELSLRNGTKRRFRVQVGIYGDEVANAINEARRKRGLLDG